MPGVPLHLIQRGNNRSVCFFSEDDYLFYLELLAEQANKNSCEIHAWCLMTNHVHLLISPHEHSSTSLLMKGIGQRYVQYINRTYGRNESGDKRKRGQTTFIEGVDNAPSI
nr:transposase [Pseudomonas frederiksbergensis]